MKLQSINWATNKINEGHSPSNMAAKKIKNKWLGITWEISSKSIFNSNLVKSCLSKAELHL